MRSDRYTAARKRSRQSPFAPGPTLYADPFFRRGWGDLFTPMRRLQAIYALISERKAFTCPPESIDWRECGPHPQDPNTLLWEGYFTSPHNDIMPAGVETCHFMMLTPAEATEWRPGAVGVALSLLNSARDILVLLPATNEETYDDRMSHGLSLVQERGAVVLAVMAPFYGPRQPLRHEMSLPPALSWRGLPLGSAPETVGEILAQNVAIISEGSESNLLVSHATITSKRHACSLTRSLGTRAVPAKYHMHQRLQLGGRNGKRRGTASLSRAPARRRRSADLLCALCGNHDARCDGRRPHAEMRRLGSPC